MRTIFSTMLLFLTLGLFAEEPRLWCEKNWGERTWEGMKFHRYHLRAENFPPTKSYRLVVESFDGLRTETFSYVANEKGHLILVPPDKDFHEEIYAICPAKKGEKLTFWMRSEEESYGTDLIPFPLEKRSKKGAKLNLELRGEKGEKFLLTVESLEPSEQIKLFLVVGETQIPLSTVVSEEGALSTFIDLALDAHGGEAQLILERSKEKVTFPFRWGPPALKIVGACCFEIK